MGSRVMVKAVMAGGLRLAVTSLIVEDRLRRSGSRRCIGRQSLRLPLPHVLKFLDDPVEYLARHIDHSLDVPVL